MRFSSTGRRGHWRRALAVTAGVGVLATGVTAAVANAAGAAAPQPGTIYELVSRSSAKAVAARSTAEGAPIVQWTRTGAPNQQFRFVSAGGGYYRVQSVLSGKVLDDRAFGTADGTPVIQYTDHGTTNQQWQLKADGGWVRLINRFSGKALDVKGWSTADGAPVQQYQDKATANQQWSLAPVGGTPAPVPVPPASGPAVPRTTQPSTPPPTVPGTTAPTAPSAPPTTAPSTSPTQAPGGSPTSCGVAPVDPQATAQARKLLCYLIGLEGHHILAGQEESTWVAGADYEMNFLLQNTGKLPAVRGMDIGDDADLGAVAAKWVTSGGIVQVGYHMGATNQGTDGYAGSQKQGDINAALTSGTSDNATLRSRLDRAATQLLKIQQAGGAAIWRPWHEAGGTWFWWSKEGGAQYQRLWRYTFDYLTQTKGLHNLLWLMPYNGSPQASFWPGKSYVDIAGADTYAGDHNPQTNLYAATEKIVGSSIPIALHENGPIPDPDQLAASKTNWVLFNTWHTTYLTDGTNNTTALLRKYYGSAYVVTKDELPDLR